MMIRNFLKGGKLENVLNVVKEKKPKFPERLKGTIVEKWANYWKQLYFDYRDVAIDVKKEIITKPIKSSIIGLTGLGVYLCVKNNPDEESFIYELREHNNKILLVHESCQRRESAQHLRFIERCINEGILRRLSLGVVSFMWLHNYDEGVNLYKAMCPFMKPDYLSFHERIIDVGFWKKWWLLQDKMIDFDVNF